MILEKEINGLFSLCMLVATKTAAFVTFEMASHTKGCYINIIDDGYDQDVEADVAICPTCGTASIVPYK